MEKEKLSVWRRPVSEMTIPQRVAMEIYVKIVEKDNFDSVNPYKPAEKAIYLADILVKHFDRKENPNDYSW